MKQKQGAFANSATGYSKKYNSKAHKSNNNKFTKSGESSEPREQREKHKKFKYDKEADKPVAEDLDNDLNSGFGNYLRSEEGK